MLSLLIHGITWGQAETDGNPEEERSPRRLRSPEVVPRCDRHHHKSSHLSEEHNQKLNQTYFLERRTFF
jgi:hypothetical protein